MPFKTRVSVYGKAGARRAKTASSMSPSWSRPPGACFGHMAQSRLQREVTSTKSLLGTRLMAGLLATGAGMIGMMGVTTASRHPLWGR